MTVDVQLALHRTASRNGRPYTAEATVMLDGRRLVAYGTGETLLEAATEAGERLDGQVRMRRERILVPRDWIGWALATQRWRRQQNTLVRELHFRDFEEGMRFVQQVAAGAEDYKRRPDISISANRVRLTIANPHCAGITLAEMRLAAKVNAVIDQLGLGRDGRRPT